MRAQLNEFLSVCNSSAAFICVQFSTNFKSFLSNDSGWKSLENDKRVPTWGFWQAKSAFRKLQGGTGVKGRTSSPFGSGGQEPHMWITYTAIVEAYKALMCEIQRGQDGTNWRKSLFSIFDQVSYKEDALVDSVFTFPYTVDARVWAFALPSSKVLLWRSYVPSKSVQKSKRRSKFEVKICQRLEELYNRP